jgi:serine phosphatase RsbU (regulator of sigma subunit)
VREILLPSSPLGTLGQSYGQETLDLEAGDVVVWLSDGFIEATDARGEAFGYERVLEALRGPGPSALEIRARLLAAVERHAAGQPPSDDRTLVLMGYRAPASEAAGVGTDGSAPSIPSAR